MRGAEKVFLDLVVPRSWGRGARQVRGVGEAEGEGGDRDEVDDGGGGGNQIWYAVDTSREAVDTHCLACQVNYRLAIVIQGMTKSSEIYVVIN